MTYQEQLRRIAGYQHGIITSAEADELDIPAVTLRKLAQRGTLRRIGHGAYRFTDSPTTVGSTEAEAIATIGDEAYIEGESVLALLDLGHANPTKVEVATRRQVRRKLPQWVKITHRTKLHDNETTHYHGVPSITLAAALEQIKNRVPKHRWKEAIEQAVRRELLTPNERQQLLPDSGNEAA